MKKGFFDDHQIFLGTSETGSTAARLNKRYAVLMDNQKDVLKGASVLDVASHDGRWSFAALSVGAERVVGIEPRGHLVENSLKSMQTLGVPREKYEFIQGDVFTVLDQPSLPDSLSVDVVLCLGFFYHTSRHMELLGLLHSLKPSAIIMDTYINSSEDIVITLNREDVSKEGKAFRDLMTVDGHTMVGRPSLTGLRFMMEHFGYEVEQLDWTPELASSAEGVEDYMEGRRVSMLARLP